LLSFYQDLERVCINKEEEPTAVSFILNAESLLELNLYSNDFYILLQQASSIGQIEDISNFQFIKKDVENPLFFEDLSEGERQRIGLLSAFAVYQGKETLFLLDEPDAFAHPRWQWDFIPDIKHQIDIENQIQQVIFATHSPIVISSLTDPAFIIEDGTIKQMNSTLGNSINLTLAEQDVPSRDSRIADDLKQYIGLIQIGKAQSEEALQLRNNLEKIFGTNHQEMKDADTLISLYE
jgi:predicted ATPase